MIERMTATLTVGTRVVFDGHQWEVRELAADRVAIRARSGESRSVAIAELLLEGRLLVEQPRATPGVGPVFAALDEDEHEQLEHRRQHVLEVLTGYKSVPQIGHVPTNRNRNIAPGDASGTASVPMALRSAVGVVRATRRVWFPRSGCQSHSPARSSARAVWSAYAGSKSSREHDH